MQVRTQFSPAWERNIVGQKDILLKDYFTPDIFADAINAILYDGKSVVTPERMRTIDIETQHVEDENGNVKLAHSISAGLDYPGVGPEHAYLRDTKRAEYVSVTDTEAMDALMELCELEGIIPAIESAHAIAYAKKYAKGLQEALGREKAMEKSLIVCLSGRGDKDVNTIADYLDGKGYLN